MSTDQYSTCRKTMEGCPTIKDLYTIEINFTETPKAKKPIEIQQSPFFCSVKRDLFSELLGTERKDEKDFMMLGRSGMKIPFEQEIEFEDEELSSAMEEEGSNDQESEEDLGEVEMQRPVFEEANQEESSKRRRRKNNLQLKILKHEFEKKQGEWTKNQILEMAELTGLSEGQVYKWCWDQKKKSTGCPNTVRQVKEPSYWNQNMEPNVPLPSHQRTKLISKKSISLRTGRKQPQESKLSTLRKRL